MNLDRYGQTEQALYAELAATVKFILEKSIAATGARPPQSIQYRAKTVASLKPKLEARGLLHSDSVEKEIKDLAGVRLIFYTNTDVDRFLDARLIPQQFEVDWDEMRIHHPTSENAQQLYRSIHYTVYLSAECLALPEYAKFSGMRCEIQIQTILNHAWAETNHDMLYKRPEAPGFGTRAFAAIEKRMTQVMDNYLLPAGYELQKVQHDFERLMQGKALFDRGTLETLVQCDNNNDRHDTLSEIRKYILPNYDDIKGIYPELCTALADAVKAARASVPKPIEFTFGTLPGKTAEDIAALVLDILDDLRYVDVERTFHTLARIYRDESDGDVCKHLLKVVEHLAAYSISMRQCVGPSVQYGLAEMLAEMTLDDRLALHSLVVAVWDALLSPSMRGTSEPALDELVFSVSPVPVSDALSAIRSRAITGLLDQWDQPLSGAQRLEVFSALSKAMRTPTQGNYSNDLCATTLNDARQIIDSLGDKLHGIPYELLQHIEYRFLREYRRARHIAEDQQDRFGCRDLAMNLMPAILAVRDRLNADGEFVRYKTLVGFETVVPPSWQNEQFDIEGDERYRRERVAEYIGTVNDSTEDDWYRLVLRCAATESQDLATFPVFEYFLVQLAKAKPATAIRFARKGDAGLMRFLPAFLNGLSQSAAEADYRALLAEQVSGGAHLAAIALHYRMTKTASPEEIREILDKAIAGGDDVTVTQCLLLAITQAESPTCSLIEHVFVPAIKRLTESRYSSWVDGAWFMSETKPFFEGLSSKQVNLVLENLVLLPEIDHRAEHLLVHIAGAHPQAVWQFFGHRLDREHDAEGERYEALPYQFHGLEQPLGQDANAAIAVVRSRFRPDDALFRFKGARLLSAVFPGFPEALARRLCDMADHASDDDLGFILAVMQNYHGEPSTHPVLQAVVNHLPENDLRLKEVDIALRNTDVVCGDFGIVDALRKKKEEIVPWLAHQSQKVRAFATGYERRIDQSIATEQRAAEQKYELRKRNFEAYTEHGS